MQPRIPKFHMPYLGIVSLLAVGILYAYGNAPASITHTPEQARQMEQSKPLAPGSPDAVLAEHPTCWVDEVPADMRKRVPGHAIVSVGDGPARYVSDPVLVGKALEAALADDPAPEHAHLAVHAFCR